MSLSQRNSISEHRVNQEMGRDQHTHHPGDHTHPCLLEDNYQMLTVCNMNNVYYEM